MRVEPKRRNERTKLVFCFSRLPIQTFAFCLFIMTAFYQTAVPLPFFFCFLSKKSEHIIFTLPPIILQSTASRLAPGFSYHFRYLPPLTDSNWPAIAPDKYELIIISYRLPRRNYGFDILHLLTYLPYRRERKINKAKILKNNQKTNECDFL